MPSFGIDFTMPKPQSARNVPSHAHSRLFHQSVPRVRRIRMDIRYVSLCHICTLQKMAKQSSAFDLAANAVQPTQQNWQNTNCTPGGSLQGDKCLVLGLGGTPAVRTTCRHQSKPLQSLHDAEIELKLNYESFIQTY